MIHHQRIGLSFNTLDNNKRKSHENCWGCQSVTYEIRYKCVKTLTQISKLLNYLYPKTKILFLSYLLREENTYLVNIMNPCIKLKQGFLFLLKASINCLYSQIKILRVSVFFIIYLLA